MVLSYEGLKDRASWQSAGIKLPEYDIEQVRKNTLECTKWVHIGGGNIFRAFIARSHQALLNRGLADSGILAVSPHDTEIIEKCYEPYDSLTLCVTLGANGDVEKEVIASVARGIRGTNCSEEERTLLENAFQNPLLQMVSFTITEKGYALKDMQGEYFPAVIADFENGPEKCTHTMSLIVALLHQRFESCGAPVALVSMDNCSGNGDVLKHSIVDVARHWQAGGFVSGEFLDWLSENGNISFPWSMIDKITPRPSMEVQEMLARDGIENMEMSVTSRNTFVAPFVNAESSEYLVIEDDFPNGRPPLEEAGVYMTDRHTVNCTEKMKVMTCLNPLHTALAVFGCMLGYTSISSEMKDEDLKALVNRIGFGEGMKVVVDPGIIRPDDFIREVLENRFPNPLIPDTPQRIATDTSQKMPIRFGETIRSYVKSKELNAADLVYIPLVIAGWMRYLLGVDDAGKPMQCSSDPLLSSLQNELREIHFGDTEVKAGSLDRILSNEKIFANDLVKIGLSGKIESMLGQMIAGPGAVRKTLHAYVSK